MKNFKQLPTEGFLCNFSWTLRQVFCSDLANKNSRTYKILAQNWSVFLKEIKILIPNIKYQRINGKNWTDFIIVKFQNLDFLKVPYFCQINSGPIFYMSGSFYWLIHYKKPVFMFMRNPSVGSCLKIFIFRPYGFDYFGFLTNARRGAMRSKTQWVIYRDLDWWPGLQKVQFGGIAGYPEVVGLILALLMCMFVNNCMHILLQCCVLECPLFCASYKPTLELK